MALIIPDKYQIIVDLVIKHNGCVFGGAIRDLIIGIDPNDFDVSIPDAKVQNFYSELISLGYQDINGKFAKGKIVVDVNELPIDAELAVEINVPLDFDVNLLAWNGKRLFNYANPDCDITEILMHIISKQAKNISATNDRIYKLVNKSWIII